jgi:hypothetical protein
MESSHFALLGVSKFDGRDDSESSRGFSGALPDD